MGFVLRLLVMVLTINLAKGDVYLHSPRGSNNRLNENRDNRANNNRLFDSQVSCPSLSTRLYGKYNLKFRPGYRENILGSACFDI